LIFIGIPEPSSLQSNRFFTNEFFSLAKEKLNKDGILVLGLPGSLTYINKELRNLNSCIFNTLESVFSHIRVFPGDGRNLFLSSDSQEITQIDTIKITERLIQRNIKADVIVPWYIEKKLHQGWQNWFTRFLEGGSKKINSDFTPVGLFYSISHWNSVFAPSLRWIFSQLERITTRSVVLLFILFLLLYFFIRSRNRQFIFTFQSIYGYVFSWIGILVASFMAGAACGAMITTTVVTRTRSCLKLFIRIELAIICFSVAFPFVILTAHEYLGRLDVFFIFRMFFLVISFISGLLTGSQFPLANKLYSQNSKSLSQTAGLLYASDLLGGWLGGILGALVLLPILGLPGTCITVGLFKLASFTVIATQPDQHLLEGGK
jgi:spermidine synthase